MRERNSKEKTFLVTDYDKCAFTTQGTHPKLLSKSLLKHVSESKYDGFYACTHRCYSMLDILKSNAVRKADNTAYTASIIATNFPTYKITLNLEEQTKLKCQAVSTVEDVLREACGTGFDEVIKPYEIDRIRPESDTPFIKLKEVSNYTKSKKHQLIQIAKHAVENYPDTTITLKYVDDNLPLCKDALTLSASELPANVFIQVYHHLADRDDAKITPMKAAPKTQMKASKPEYEKKEDVHQGNGLFSMRTRSMAEAKPVQRHRLG